jgi:hypothetical protein
MKLAMNMNVTTIDMGAAILDLPGRDDLLKLLI